MKMRVALSGLAVGAILAMPAVARADNRPVTPLWLQMQNNAILQSQIDQLRAQQRMQQQLDEQQLRLITRQQVMQSDRDLSRLQLRFQVDQQNANLSGLLQQQELLLLNLQQSTKPLPKSVLDQLRQPQQPDRSQKQKP